MFNDIIKILKDKNGIEFGGPTELFYNSIFNMMLYNHVNLDGGNIFENNYFQNNIDENNYTYGGKVGRQYNIDCTSEYDIKKIEKKYDFILTSHVIEHIANPIKTLLSWNEILKNDGYILSIIPDYKFCFDRNRPLTTIKHLIDDYNNNINENDITHIEEQLKLHDWSMGGHKDFNNLCKNNEQTRVVHHHTFDFQLCKELFEYCGYKNIITYKQDELNIVILCQKK